MIYAIVKVTDGNYNIHSEGIANINNAIVQFHQLCAALWNDPDTTTACVMIVDTNLDTVAGYKEFISHVELMEDDEGEHEPE
jgi:hypothetical protein